MSVQAGLNNEAMKMVPRVLKIITNAEIFEANQMEHSTLRKIINSDKPIDEMSDKELEEFQEDLIFFFKHKNWLNSEQMEK